MLEKLACTLLLAALAGPVPAATCPTPQEIRARLIPEDYDWSVSENVSLESLLTVSELYGVSIENYGEFVACKYTATGQYVRLDGVPRESGCPLIGISDNWAVNYVGQLVCDDEEFGTCVFDTGC